MAAYEIAESKLRELRSEIKEGIHQSLVDKGFGINQTAVGYGIEVKADYDWEHIIYKRGDAMWSHVDNADTETLLEIWRAVLRCVPNY